MMPEKFDNRRDASHVLLSGTLVLGLALALISTAFGDSEAITIRWKRPGSPPVCLAMSAGGTHFGTVDAKGTVQLLNRNGRLVWKQIVPDATDIMIAGSGQTLLVYSRLDPVHRDVYFYRGDGTRLWKHTVEGSVWSGSVSPDGRYAAVTTGDRYVYVYKPDPTRPRYRRWRLDGIGHCVTFTPDSKRIVVGTWQESGLACYNLEGRFQWRSRHDTERQYELRNSADGKTILGLLPASQHDPGIELRLWDCAGKSLWRKQLDGFEAKALVSPGSQYVAISYADFLSKEGDGIVERKVAVYEVNGRLVWEKGGLFFGPQLAALSPKGSSVIVSDGEKSLYNIDKRGKILSKLTLSGTIRKTLSSDDGRRILLYCGDGWLYFMHVG
jgi:outer membrane protein assembly factor BamB